MKERRRSATSDMLFDGAGEPLLDTGTAPFVTLRGQPMDQIAGTTSRASASGV